MKTPEDWLAEFDTGPIDREWIIAFVKAIQLDAQRPSKDHHFMVTVKSNRTRQGAEMAILSAFASRRPDGCEFYLNHIS